VTVTLVLPSAKPSSSGDSEKGNEISSYELVRATAATYEEALLVLRTTIPRYISFSQLLQVVVSDKLARSDTFSELLSSILKTSRLKQSAVLAVSRCSAADFLKAQQPFLGIRLSANIETSFAVYADLGNVPVTAIGQARRNLFGAWETPLLPLVSLNWMAEDQSALPGDPLGTVAGTLPYDGNDPTEYLGAAVIAQGRMAGMLTGAEMELISLLRGDVDEITFSHDGVICRLTRRSRPTLRAQEKDGQWTLSVSGHVHTDSECTVSPAPKNAFVTASCKSMDTVEITV